MIKNTFCKLKSESAARQESVSPTALYSHSRKISQSTFSARDHAYLYHRHYGITRVIF